MINCPFEQVADLWWLCPDCGFLYYGEKAPKKNCKKKYILPEERRHQMHERLLHKIDEAVDSGVATRSYGEIGRCLAVCQRCDCWVDERCGEDDMCTNKARRVFFMRLTKASLGCDRWSKRDPEGQRSE